MAAVLYTLPEWTWDKLCAAYVTLRCLFGATEVANVAALLASGKATFVFQDEGPFPTDAHDIDVVRDYKKQPGFDSATKVAACGQNLKEVNLPGLDKLLEMLGKNNGYGQENKRLGGYLKDEKRFPGSLVGLIRAAYRVNHNVDRRIFRLRVIAAFWPCVHAYFQAYLVDPDAVESLENPFTLSNVETLFKLSGVGAEEAEEMLDAIKAFQPGVEVRERQAAERASRLKPEQTFSLRVRNNAEVVTGHLLMTDDLWVAKHYLRLHQDVVILVVAPRENGHCTILVKGSQSFKKLVDALNAQEGRLGQDGKPLWHLLERSRSPWLMRGGPTRPLRRDQVNLTPAAVVEEVRKHFEYTKPS